MLNKETSHLEVVEADVIIWCTGYQYNLNYLHEPDNILSVRYDQGARGKYMSPLYMKMISVTEPRFICLGATTFNPYPIMTAEHQAIAVYHLVKGNWILPTKERMALEVRISELKQFAFGKNLDQVMKFDFFGEMPHTYADKLRDAINKSGVVKLTRDP